MVDVVFLRVVEEEAGVDCSGAEEDMVDVDW